MKIISNIIESKQWLNTFKNEGKTIGFVPTMGALHPGHLSLVERARKENDLAVASIFVNPLQFNDKKDLEKYPRTLEDDVEMLKSAKCDLLFSPTVEGMYGKQPENKSQDAETIIDLGTLDKIMEGAHRPGHFQGVCTVVKKLFEIIQPTKTYFGEKDFQQLAIIKRMVNVLNIPTVIVPCPTFREADGLAMSSRNRLLSTDDRTNAPHIYRTLMATKNTKGTISQIKKWVEDQINSNPFMKLEYFEIVNAETLQPVQSLNEAPLRACIAVKMGAVRLIDNIAF